ncbi:Qat anti-phage system TatD family nuclease QatD [Aminobacter ciceronei]|uniref:TatD DNase family protein n=1 Tax=Aminobacter ciceronei TaxID=150723 RepID=A0ABR6C610_9HYPH|nr:Qat anti-phage system TatD family nuclease QatD [Aminobacter ciceronei]MBA8906471.1 TatD DNase family protein [Aminobacter ciceronei]MBA9020403.1 TatD DNase family protein [Aminobacter ciceronei]
MIDFHCHLDLFPVPSIAADDIERTGAYVLSVTNTPKAFPKTAQLAKGHRRIRTALGLHPQLVHERHTEVGMFMRLLGETAYVGEIGIDGGNDFAQHRSVQMEVFDRILRGCSDVGGRVMSIHSRHASGEVIEALRRHPTAGVAILHWFSGPVSHAELAAGMGAWFSVGLPMLRSRRASTLISCIPRDRILTETDAPFASTTGERYPTTALKDTVSALSRIWGCDIATTQKQLDLNLRALAMKSDGFMSRALVH